ncbi:MAG: CotH protein [Firmicutes bacterium ADurb.Bin419]|nr:MAG: CotH protein [Firmicutes bacterium ADurb.Bin419]
MFDIDEILRFWAVNTFLVNLDSYAGGMYHNYYLYEENGFFTLLPWDFNMSFAGFGINNASNVINFPIDKPVTGNLEDAPLIGKLLEVDEYKARYHGYLKKIVVEYVGNGIYENSINRVNALISDYVKNDATAFYTFEEYKKAVPAMKTFGKDRAASIAAQLDGTQPSTTYGTISTTLNLNDLGIMGGGFGGFGRNDNTKANPQQSNSPGQQNMQPSGGNMQFPNGMQLPDGMQPSDGMQLPDGIQPPNGMQPRGDMEAPRGQQRNRGNIKNPGGMLRDNIPQLENMQEVMKIINEANGKELTDDQKKRLESLGVDENMLKQFQNMPQRMGFPGNVNFRNPSGITISEIIILAVMIVTLSLGMIFVAKFRRKKYVICK